MTWLRDIGLNGHGGKHSHPDSTPDIRVLLEAYKSEQLHSYRPGRRIEPVMVDQYTDGVKALQKGLLRKFVDQTTRTRGLMNPGRDPQEKDGMEADDEEDDADETDEEEGEEAQLAVMEVVNGRLEMTRINMEEEREKLEKLLEEVGYELDASSDIEASAGDAEDMDDAE